MAIDTVRLRTESTDTDGPATDGMDTDSPRGIVDVSELPAGRVGALAPAAPDREVHFERRAGRTYLIAGD